MLGLALLDVREKDAFIAGHIPGALHLPRGQLELRVDQELSDPTERILTCCEFGHISTLAAFTLRTLGYRRAAALDGGMKAWRGNERTAGDRPGPLTMAPLFVTVEERRHKRKHPARAGCVERLGAGTGFEPVTFRL